MTFEEITKSVRVDGYVIHKSALTRGMIDGIIRETDELLKGYSVQGVKDRLWFLREESGNRQGDAVMVSKAESVMPSVEMGPVTNIVMQYYHDIMSNILGRKIPENSRCMFNSQQYFSESFETTDHYDGFFIDFEHGAKNQYDEKPLIINKGLLPRYVMVAVLSNENSGGLYVRDHTSDERITIELNAGDIIVFDNIRMRHGVPSLPLPRRIIGFRDFDFQPFLFQTEKDTGFFPLHDEVNPGFIKPISYGESIVIQRDELEEWKLNADEQIKKPAAF